jgi:hypothetical protein
VARSRKSSRAEASISLRGSLVSTTTLLRERFRRPVWAAKVGANRCWFFHSLQLYGSSARHRAVPTAPKFLRLRMRDDVQRSIGAGTPPIIRNLAAKAHGRHLPVAGKSGLAGHQNAPSRTFACLSSVVRRRDGRCHWLYASNDTHRCPLICMLVVRRPSSKAIFGAFHTPRIVLSPNPRESAVDDGNMQRP